MAIWQSSAIGGKFASRLFARFLLAAAIPIAAVAGLSYLYTSDVVHGQAHERLHRAASTYGHGVYNRLLLARNQIRMIEAAAGGTQPLQSQALRIVVQSPSSASPRALIGDPESLPRDLPIPQVKTDHPGIYLHYGDDSIQPHMYLVLGASSSDGLIIGEIDPDYLFGSVQEWPYATRYCVRQLPVDTVKIDRLFVKDIEHSPEALTIVETIINMVHALGRRVVAEGLETHKQLELLTERNCDLGQGFLFAAPLEISSLELYLRTRGSSHGDHSGD